MRSLEGKAEMVKIDGELGRILMNDSEGRKGRERT
jgi:hypothetical protein